MKDYKSEEISDFMFWELKHICSDFDGFCESQKMTYNSLGKSEHFDLVSGKVFYIETDSEKGIVVYNPEQECNTYYVPDSINVDLEKGTVESENSFTAYVTN